MYVLSPYVWKEAGRYDILVRAVPRRRNPKDKVSSIFFGEGDDGLRFGMRPEPAIAPSTQDDRDGCEDPTVQRCGDRYHVFYSGWNEKRHEGLLLAAHGKSIAALKKTGRILPADDRFANCKEATVARRADGSWRLFFEYARDGHSKIGMAAAPALDGVWRYEEPPFDTREGCWDNWHLSTGPIVPTRLGPVMFYNGASQDAVWRVGWIAFDENFTRTVDRCTDPLFAPRAPKSSLRDIAFAASAVLDGEDVWLYYTLSDAYLHRAVIRYGEGASGRALDRRPGTSGIEPKRNHA
jgi:predicted GH43/DUF377 family glycosyl hydrolase